MAKPQMKKSLETFNQELAEVHMTGQWIYEDLLSRAIGGPRPRGDAYLWPWPMVHEKLLEACNVLEESFTARRSVLFGNPGLNDNATTHTLLMGVQMIKPGEIAWAHRHTLAAIRFVIKGDGKVFTVVDGEKCPMEPYDLILTPQWTWHDHRNPTQESAMWVDALDVPFLLGLNQPFYEPYPGNNVQTIRDKAGDIYSSAPAPCDRHGKTPKRKICRCATPGKISSRNCARSPIRPAVPTTAWRWST